MYTVRKAIVVLLVAVTGMALSVSLRRDNSIGNAYLNRISERFIRKPVALTPGIPMPNIVKSEVIPESADLGVSFGDTVSKMLRYGAIDKEKFLALYKDRGALSQEAVAYLENPSAGNIVINENNAGLLLNLLWPLGIANNTNLLKQGPIGSGPANEIGNYASTGGWTVGKEPGGQLFNAFPLVPLTPKQEAVVSEIAKNIYRPCCGNSTYFPDCNHGAAMLGFIELAVLHGMPEQEIYRKALILNSYWFPQTYMELAVYMKAKYRTDWNRVDPRRMLGIEYSSGQGYAAFHKELEIAKLIPEVKGGGGCGV